MINRENYEIYFLDFFDNNLSKEKAQLLFDFLEENPDLKEEFDQFKNLSLQKDSPNEKLNDFSGLKKPLKINVLNEDDYFIGDLEGDLTELESEELSDYLFEFKDRKKKFLRYQKTKLVAPTIIFSGKYKLKKGRVVPLYYYISGAAVAASIGFLIWTNPLDTNISLGNVNDLSELNFPKAKQVMNNYQVDNEIIQIVRKNNDENSNVKREREKLELISSNNNLDEHIFISDIKEVALPDSVPLVSFSEDFEFIAHENRSKQKTNVITPRKLLNRGISKMFLGETKNELKSKDFLAVAGVKIEDKIQKNTLNKESKNTGNEYSIVKIGRFFEFKRKKRK